MSFFSFTEGGSVETVLAGKHYNRTIRIYQYLYAILVRLQCESFEKNVKEGETLLQELTSSEDFQKCLLEVFFEFFLLFLQP